MTDPLSRGRHEDSALHPIQNNPFAKGRAAVRAAYARRLGESVLLSLVERIEAAYEQVPCFIHSVNIIISALRLKLLCN